MAVDGEYDEEEESGGIEATLNNLKIETAGMEEEAEEQLDVVLEMEVEETGEVEEEGDGTLRALGAIEFLTQDADLSRTTLVDASNGFNKLSSLAMLWTVRHRWPAGARFAFNCYKHWAQLLLRHPGEPPVTILIQEGLTQGYPLLMVLYGINFVPLAKELRASDQGLLSPFYADDAAFGGLERRSSQLLKLLMKRGPDHVYFTEPARSLFILDTPRQEEAAKREYAVEGLALNFVRGIRYLGAYLGLQEELDT